MIKNIVLVLLISSITIVSGCGKILQLIDSVPEPTKTDTTTQQPVSQPTQPVSKYTKPILTIQMINGKDALLTWTNTGATSYTVERNYWNDPSSGWEEIATFSGFTMTFNNAHWSGIHYYRIRANYEDEISKTSLVGTFNPN